MALQLHFMPLTCSVITDFLPGHALGRSARGSHLSRHVKPLASIETYEPMAPRRSANYQPSIWSHNFAGSLKSDYAEERYEERAAKLKEEVKHMLDYEDVGPLARLELIDDLQRLGLRYHFEKDIKRALDSIICFQADNERVLCSLHATALRFRILRQHRYEVSQDVFKSFKDRTGDFMACLCEDFKGMLSLYEASYLAFEGENLLDEAKAFTSTHLKRLKGNIDPTLAEQVTHALELPLHWRMARLEVRWYIEAYERRKDTNHVLLELAKLDFNVVQSTHQRDLKDLSRWWRGMGLGDRLSFARDRLIECFFWSMGMVFEPQFGYCRKGLTKVTALITTIDDVYDVYGSLDELELFTDAVERWDVNAVKQLPHYMKICFLALYNTVNEMAYDTLKEQGCDVIPYLKKVWADLCKAFLVEAKWYFNRYTPTLEDYLENAWISVSGNVILVHAYFLLNQDITEEALECLESYSNLIRWSSMIFRLYNDLGTSTAEVEKGEVATSIQCYMHETGLSEELAREHTRHLINEMWKKMNKDGASDSPFPDPFIETTINLARISQCTYQNGDGHGAPDRKKKDQILSLLAEPVFLMERLN
ncbi:hypothetical protein HHK36_023753 [Tetracentron sinense]|uniref:Uncharacterized protein n=1 Tax=Tetracentron sinense TaxID=13715 RepID=A0A834YRQ1_TETSI|nr:hypothetical protein HHK36_023753 [Tetracentron sinense]